MAREMEKKEDTRRKSVRSEEEEDGELENGKGN